MHYSIAMSKLNNCLLWPSFDTILLPQLIDSANVDCQLQLAVNTARDSLDFQRSASSMESARESRSPLLIEGRSLLAKFL
jgi:hypothetical protein